jgi:hypothetical protein
VCPRLLLRVSFTLADCLAEKKDAALLNPLSVSQLKQFTKLYRIDISGAFEKSEIINEYAPSSYSFIFISLSGLLLQTLTMETKKVN